MMNRIRRIAGALAAVALLALLLLVLLRAGSYRSMLDDAAPAAEAPATAAPQAEK